MSIYVRVLSHSPLPPSPLLLSVVTLYDPELLLSSDSGDRRSSSRASRLVESCSEGTDGISSVVSLSVASENINSCERLNVVFLVPFVISVSDFTKIKFKMQILLLKYFQLDRWMFIKLEKNYIN